MRHARSFLLALLALTLIASPALAVPLGTIAIEGQLRTVAGSPVPDGNYTLKVSLYKDKQDPKALHSETIATKVSGGGFMVSLGLAQALKSDLFADGSAAWIGVQVDTEAELPRLPLNHVAYAFRADHALSAADLKCSGCISADHLDKTVLADYAKTAALKGLVPVDQKCDAGEVVAGFDAAGKVVCAKDANDTYTGKNFALASQACPVGQVVSKIDADGKVFCELGGKTYTGKDFALADQKCAPGQVVTSIDSGGKITCALDQKGQVTGADFALSDQSCGKGKVMRGVAKDGKAICATIAYEEAIPAGTMSKTEVTNLQQGKLADGKTPWTAEAAYGENAEGFLSPTDTKKPFKAQSKGGQMVFRADSTTQYASGIGAYPFVFMFGGNVVANRTALIHSDGTVWTKQYGWLHTRFAAANQKCKVGEFAAGISAAGALVCLKDANNTYGAGTYMKLEAGSKFGADLAAFDKRYVNEGQANSVTSAMIKDGEITGADVKDSSLTGSDIADATLTGSDIKDSTIASADILNDSLTGADIKNSSLTGADVADESLTGSDIKNGTVASADITDESLTGSDIKNGTVASADITDESLTSADIKNSSLTGADVANESLTGAHIKNGTVTRDDITDNTLRYTDTDVNSIQRRVAGKCPAGQAITTVNSNGTVVCASVDAIALVPGACKAGEWRRVAENSGNRFDGLFIVRDFISGGGHSTMTFRLGGAYGDTNGYSFSLLNHAYHSTPTFSNVRVVHKSTYDKTYVEILCKRTGSVSLGLHQNQHSAGFTTVAWTLGSIPSGYTAKTWDSNRLLAVGNTVERFAVDRSGNVTNAGGTTSAGVIRSNGGINVDGNTVIDNGGAWHRSYGNTGFINATHGGGIYMTDATWVRVYNKKALLVDNNLYVSGSIGIKDSTPSYALDVNGDGRFVSNVGIQSTPRSGYALDVGGHIDLSNKDINYVNQLHFNDNVRFYDSGADNYLDFKYGDAAHGGIRIYDGGGVRQGTLYADGNDTNPSFGLLDGDGNWAVRVRDDDYTALYRNGIEKFRVHSTGGKVTGNLEVTGSLTVASKTLDVYIRDYINTKCYVYFGWRDNQDGSAGFPYKAGRAGGNNCNSNLGTSSTNNDCAYFNLNNDGTTTSIRMFGLNTDGTVNGDDKFWIGFRCW